MSKDENISDVQNNISSPVQGNVMNPFHEEYLKKALSLPHSGRSLWDHLKGTWKLLSDAGYPQYICDAGLFHSVYGTRQYRYQCVSFEKRDDIADLIGLRAENLVYYFCVIDRPRVLFAGERIVWNYHTEKEENINIWFDDLLTIEFANLEEQDEFKRKV
jgi:hypothetical protein